ncbi:MAG: hypothetical protein NZ602_09760 [Thermoguttaceae bacterium]|nr:hypothetical protein [Thermoguttaceae bacterium]
MGCICNSGWAIGPVHRQDVCILVFTASHDGVGLRAVERLFPAQRIQELIARVPAPKG